MGGPEQRGPTYLGPHSQPPTAAACAAPSCSCHLALLHGAVVVVVVADPQSTGVTWAAAPGRPSRVSRNCAWHRAAWMCGEFSMCTAPHPYPGCKLCSITAPWLLSPCGAASERFGLVWVNAVDQCMVGPRMMPGACWLQLLLTAGCGWHASA